MGQFPFALSPGRYRTWRCEARQALGEILNDVLLDIQRFLGLQRTARAAQEIQRLLTYLESVLSPRYSKEAVGLRTSRELRTLAEALDELHEGNATRAGDLLIQRFKTLRTSVIVG